MATAGVELYAELKRQGLGDQDLAVVRQTISNLSDSANTRTMPRRKGQLHSMSALFDLTGRVALVTGSSRGIGNALARALADAGATVVLNGINAERLKAAEAAMAADYRAGAGAQLSRLMSPAMPRPRGGIAWVEEHVGPLEILVNNAGIQHRVPMLELDVTDWERVISTDLTSAFLVGREAARHMIPRGQRARSSTSARCRRTWPGPRSPRMSRPRAGCGT